MTANIYSLTQDFFLNTLIFISSVGGKDDKKLPSGNVYSSQYSTQEIYNFSDTVETNSFCWNGILKVRLGTW